MAYVDQGRDPARKAATIIAVGAIHAVIAVGLVAGLTVAGFTERKPRIASFDLDDPLPIPTPEPVPETPAAQLELPRMPLPPLPLPPQPVPTIEVLDPVDDARFDLPSRPLPVPSTPAATATPSPLPSPSFTPKSAAPRSSPSSWISTDDYPARPLRAGVEGQTGYRLVIGSDGRVSACEITASSGSSELDRETCRLITRRARFEPATDSAGARVVSTYTGTVRWEIPD